MSQLVLIRSPIANLTSVSGALQRLGIELELSEDAATVRNAERIILPGVGSFRPAITWLEERGLSEAILEAVTNGASLLGICLGHQILFERSYEGGETAGLGILSGSVARLPDRSTRIGWIPTETNGDPLFRGIPDAWFYFVHSWAVTRSAASIATTAGPDGIVAAASSGRVRGVQFHPERSAGAGLQLLRNFVELI